ncbi:MAG: carbon-nitrogen hydrolase family protein, partial [Actinomycetota bacterium]|nr:carbon-nitrogen hydrolase family protein [Actinomycetota bacterium]
MSRTLTILVAQARPVPFDAEATFAKFEWEVRMLTEAFPHADLLIFPELYLTGEDPFTPGPPRYEHLVAEEIPGPLTDRVAKVAERAGRHI